MFSEKCLPALALIVLVVLCLGAVLTSETLALGSKEAEAGISAKSRIAATDGKTACLADPIGLVGG